MQLDMLWEEYSGERMGRGTRLFTLAETPLSRALVRWTESTASTDLVWSSKCEVFSLGTVTSSCDVIFGDDPKLRARGALEDALKRAPAAQLVCCLRVLADSTFEVLR